MKKYLLLYLQLFSCVQIFSNTTQNKETSHSQLNSHIPIEPNEIKILPLGGLWSKKEVFLNCVAVVYFLNHYYWLIQKGKNVPKHSLYDAIDLAVTPFIGTYLIFQLVRWYFYMLNTPQQTLEEYVNNQRNNNKQNREEPKNKNFEINICES